MSEVLGESTSTGGVEARSSDWLARREAGSHGSHETDRKGSSSVGPHSDDSFKEGGRVGEFWHMVMVRGPERANRAKRSYEVAERRANSALSELAEKKDD